MASSPVNHAISATVMMALDALPRACAMILRRLGSGMFTVCTTIWSNSTVTPLFWRVGMWVLMDSALRGFPLTSTASPFLNPVFATRGQRSDMELWSIHNSSRLVSPASAEMLEIRFPPRSSIVRSVNLATIEMFDMEFVKRFRYISRVNLARGEMSDMKFSASSSCVSLVNPARGEMSEILFSPSHNHIRLVAVSSPVKLRMF